MASASERAAASAWDELCAALARAGREISGIGAGGRPSDQADGYRYLARLAVFAVQWHLEFADPRHPAFFRFDDDVTQWGAPNADNHYLRAAVDATGVYRISGDVTGVRQLILSTHRGDMALGEHRVFAERSLDELCPAADGRLDVILAREDPAGCTSTFVPLHDGVEYVLVRVYVPDWEHDGLGDLAIERVDTAGTAPEPLDPGRVADALRRAAAWTERSLAFWDTYSRRIAAGVAPNTLTPPMRVPDGAADIRYGSGTWRLGGDDVLLVTFEEPQARYWSIQAYTIGWFEGIELRHRATSLNGAQAHVDADGKVRVAVCGRDPGSANWLDTAGHTEGILTYRWVWATTFPEPESVVVPLAGLADHLPAGHPLVAPDERRRALAARQRGIARRFRR